MAKGIFVLDIPEICSLCPLEREGAYCMHVNADTMDFRYKGKHIDCPIKPLPIGYYSADQDEMSLYCKGFNKCLEEILKGTEE